MTSHAVPICCHAPLSTSSSPQFHRLALRAIERPRAFPLPGTGERARVRVAEMAVARRCESGNLYRPTNSFPAHRTTSPTGTRGTMPAPIRARAPRRTRVPHGQNPASGGSIMKTRFAPMIIGLAIVAGSGSDAARHSRSVRRSGIGEGHAVALGHGRECPRRNPRGQGRNRLAARALKPRGVRTSRRLAVRTCSRRGRRTCNRRGVRTCSRLAARTCSRRDQARPQSEPRARTRVTAQPGRAIAAESGRAVTTWPGRAVAAIAGRRSHRAVRTFSRLAGRASSRAEAMTSRRLAAVRLRELRISRILLRQRRPGAS